MSSGRGSLAGSEIIARRLRNQRLIGARFATAADVVTWLCAVQAQDYRGALWAVAQRTRGATDADVEHALTERAIVRSWPMRGTLHFVAPADLRWMLALLAPRVIARSAGRHRELGLDAATFDRSTVILRRALAGGVQLTRDEGYVALQRGKVTTAGQRGIHILGRLALDGVLCFGAPRGKQQTFTLVDDWIPTSRTFDDRDEALGELARRYVTSHGPITLDDFAWWSGLPQSDARRGLDVAAPELAVRGEHWDSRARAAADAASAHLLPAYDEYAVAYRDRSAILDPAHAVRAKNGIFSPVVVLDGKIAGTWKRAIARGTVAITASLFTRPSRAARELLEAEAERYGRFVGLTAMLTIA